MDGEFERWMTQRQSARVIELLQRRTRVADVSRQYDLTLSEIEEGFEYANAYIENVAPEMRCLQPTSDTLMLASAFLRFAIIWISVNWGGRIVSSSDHDAGILCALPVAPEGKRTAPNIRKIAS